MTSSFSVCVCVPQVDGTELQEAYWFSRDDVISMICEQHPKKLAVPPPQALAHQLIKQWLLRSAFDEAARDVATSTAPTTLQRQS